MLQNGPGKTNLQVACVTPKCSGNSNPYSITTHIITIIDLSPKGLFTLQGSLFIQSKGGFRSFAFS